MQLAGGWGVLIYALGAQRKAVRGSQLAQVKAELGAWMQAGRAGGGEGLESSIGFAVPRSDLLAEDSVTLSAERYVTRDSSQSGYPMVSLGDESLFKVEGGGTPKSDVPEFWDGGIPWATLVDLPACNFITEITGTVRTISDSGLKSSSAKMLPANSVLVSSRATIGRIAINRVPLATNQGFKNIVIADGTKALPEYVALAVTRLVSTMQSWATGGTFAEISKSKFCELEIPLPPLEMQREIVAEVEGYQRVIDGARAVLDNYRPHIPVDPAWPIKTLEEVAQINPDSLNPEREFPGGQINYFDIASIENHSGRVLEPTLVAAADAPSRARRKIEQNDLLISTVRPNLRAFGILRSVPRNAVASTGLAVIRAVEGVSDPFFLLQSIRSDASLGQLTARMEKGSYPSVNQADMAALRLPMPPIEEQKAIAAEIEAEQALVNGNRDLIARFEKKIDAAIARVWGEAKGEGEA